MRTPARDRGVGRRGRGSTALTADPWLAHPEIATTLLAASISTGLYVRGGAPYLARGVVGDLVGLAVLAMLLRVRGERARHEALVCLVAIGVVSATRARWPLRVPSIGWWLVIVPVLVSYLRYRARQLRR